MIDAAFSAATGLAQEGPAEIVLRDQATFRLPMGLVFISTGLSTQIMQAMGNHADGDLLGLVVPNDAQSSWFIVLTYHPSGYITDENARKWNTDDLLESLKAAAQEANNERRARRIPEIEVEGWVEKPHYDAKARLLVWSVSSLEKGSADPAAREVNYDVYALGRDGYIAMNLVTRMESFITHKIVVKELLDTLEFIEGKRHGDYDASRNRVAAYGFAALVAGFAARKLAVSARPAALLAKLLNALASGTLAAMAFVGNRWKRKTGR